MNSSHLGSLYAARCSKIPVWAPTSTPPVVSWARPSPRPPTAGRRGSAIPPRPRPARFTSGRRRLRLPTRKASRSASNGLSVATLGRNGRRGLPRRSVFLPIPSAIMAPKPSLRTELLLNLAFLAAAALLLGVGTIVAVQALAPDLSPGQVLPLLLAIVALDVGIFIVFGGYLVRRHILRPLGRVIAV